ncbi:hypothetical protein BSKO_14120 [Bryopsis sp. KO-2023]|nr:hypothetical protein BSKO_14120 [Bryopsis sp. KO-2023]
MARRWRQKPAIGTRLVWFLAIGALFFDAESRGLFQNENNGGRKGGGSGGGFLAEELPLEIVTTTPVSISTAIDEVEVEGDQALTVVFSRPVIALGQDFGTEELPEDKVPFTLNPGIAGRFRWVTTYIARWDPEDGWPLDMDIQFEWNKKLTTHDGLPLRLGVVPERLNLTTPTLSMTLGRVTSEKAENLTDDEWDSNLGLNTDHLPEVPPDGVIELRFDSPVSIKVLNSDLKVLDDKFEVVKDLEPSSKPCKKAPKVIIPVALCPECEDGESNGGSKEENECVEVTITGDLGVGKLRSSEINFVSSRALNIWLPHGLENGEKDLNKFKKQIRLAVEDDEIEFKLTMKNKGKVQMYASILPSQTYKSLVFEADQDWGKKIVSVWKGKDSGSRCKIKEFRSKVNIFQILSNKSLKALLPKLSRYGQSDPLVSTIKDPMMEVVAQTNDKIGEIVEADISKFLKPTGIVAYEYCKYGRTASVLMESSIQAIVVGSSFGSSIVWVTCMKTGKPIEGARVTIYEGKFTWGEPFTADQFEEISKPVMTDKDGKAIVEEPLNNDMLVHIEYKKRSLFVSPISSGYFEEVDSTRVVIVLDRKLVRPGETLHVKGYILDHDGESWKPSSKDGYTYSAFVSSPDLRIDSVIIELDEKFGTFELRIPVPENATLSTYDVRVDNDGSFLGRETFVVGDPRPPTVGLSIDAPVWAKPDSKIEVEMTVESFIGAAVGDADISFEWLELADIVASLMLTASTDIPGQKFGVGVSLTNLADVALEPMPVTVHLKKLPEVEEEEEESPSRLKKSSEPIEGDVEESCDVESDSGEWCRFKLPGLGNFALEVCVKEGEGKKSVNVCTREFIGKTPDEWRPLDDHLNMGLRMLSEGPFKVGDAVKFGIENPYANARAIVVWGSSLGSDHKLVSLDDFAFSEFSIELGAICEFNCGVSIGVSIPRQTEGVAFTQSDVPISKLFDLAAPHFVRLTETILVEQDFSMDVRIPFPTASPDEGDPPELVVPPGESTTLKVEVDGDEGGDVEVTVIAVDKAVLELVPLALRDLAMEFVLAYQGEFGLRDSSTSLVAPKAIQAVIDNFLAKAKLDPWFVPSLNLGRDHTIDLTDEEYLDRESEEITRQFASIFFDERPSFARSSASGLAFEAPAASAFTIEPLQAAAGSPQLFKSGRIIGGVASRSAPPPPPPNDGESGSTLTARIQDEFVSTPLFETVVSKNGVAEVNFTAPGNLGTFVVRAYAVSGGGKFGSAENELIVRRDVSLTPSAPRFVRVGDEFEAGAVVTVSGAKTSPTVDVKVVLEGDSGELLEIVEESEASVEIGDDGTSEVRFLFKAKSMGDATFKITADDGSGGSDALVIDFPVEGLQEAVTLASSFAIDGGNAGSWQEGLQLPDAVPGSGGVSIQAGVGRLPSILSLAQQIYERNPKHECPISADYALALAAIPFITETYDVLGLDRNELEKGTAEMLDGMISNFTAAIGTLGDITSRELGLIYALRCPSSFVKQNTPPREPSISQNARGAWIMQELGEDVRDSLLNGAQEGVISLAAFEEDWLAALETALVQEAIELRSEFDAPISVWMVAFARAVLGSWSPPQSTPTTVVDDLSMERLSNELQEMGVESQAYYVLELLRRNPIDRHPDVKIAVDAWTSNFRVTGRTAYVANSIGSSTPASNVANSLVLMAMTRAGVSNPLIEKLANYVASPPVGEYGFRLFSDFDKTTAMIAMRDYDRSRGSTMPDVSLNVRSGEVVLLEATFKQNSNPVESTTTPWKDLDSPPQPLEFTAEGKGEVTLAASLTFIPQKLLAFPTYRGIFLERAIRVPESNGPTLTKVPVGSVVDIAVQLTTPDRLGLTTVRAMMPAGLEPVDPTISQSDSFCPIANIELDSGRRRWSRRRSPIYFFMCPEQETRPSVVTFTFSRINAGTVTITFRAVAATVGTFALPPVRAFVDDQPEVMGLSSAGELIVCSGCEAEEGALPKTPKSCPNNCSDNGACNLDSGKCVCLTGFTGDDCAELAAV